MPTLTTNYGLAKPLVNNPVDQDQFGGEINNDLDIIDSALDLRVNNLNFNDKTLSAALMKDTAEAVYNAGSVSGAVAIDYTNGQYQYMTATGNITSLTVSNWPISGRLGFMTLEITQDGTRTLALTSAYKTPSAAGAALTSGATATDFLYITTRDAGTTINTNINRDYR